MNKDLSLFMRSHGISSLRQHDYITSEWKPNPIILEESKLNMTAVDVFSRLMADRIIMLGSDIYEDISNVIVSQLLWLNTQSNDRITLYINSPGGSVTNGMAIYDTMQLIKSPVSTICCGYAASMAAVILAGGEKGFRGSLKHSDIMIHQPSGGQIGQASDIEIASRMIQRTKDMLYGVLAEDTGKDIEQIRKDADRDYWMTPYEAKDYGIIDEVFEKRAIL